MATKPLLTVVGGGLAGCEAAFAAANCGVDVELFEMRPSVMTGAHQTDALAELVCSNSFKSQNPDSPAGLLKAEMEALGSLIISTGKRHSVPGGEALAIDRIAFANEVTEIISSHPHIQVNRRHFAPSDLEDRGLVIIATGPLTSPELAKWLGELTGQKNLFFYDAVSPTVDASTVDQSIVFAQSRYDKGEGDDYLNCPFTKEEYYAFIDALLAAERAPVHGFEADGSEEGLVEKIKYFAGCMPIEAIAEKGRDSLRFGNFKPVGLTDPRTGRRPYAALQLRPENREKTLYSLVACQNRLKWGDQTRVLRLVPGLQNAEFVRLGVIHRNTYLNAPAALDSQLRLVARPSIYVAGQLTGVEGYVESAAMGILTGRFTAATLAGRELAPPPRPTALGSLLSHLSDATPREFAPMNINWGLLPPPQEVLRDKGQVRIAKLTAARTAFSEWLPTAN